MSDFFGVVLKVAGIGSLVSVVAHPEFCVKRNKRWHGRRTPLHRRPAETIYFGSIAPRRKNS